MEKGSTPCVSIYRSFIGHFLTRLKMSSGKSIKGSVVTIINKYWKTGWCFFQKMIRFLYPWHILVLNASVCCEKISLTLSCHYEAGKIWLGSPGTSCLATQWTANQLRHPHHSLRPARLVADPLTRQQRKAPRLNFDRLSQGSRRPNLAAIMPTTFIWKLALLTRALIIWKSLLPSNDRRQTSAHL